MNHDAQQELQQRSLRNVRALLDKLEAEADSERRSRKWLALTLVVCAAALFAGYYFITKARVVSRTMVSEPAGRAGSPAAPTAPAPAPAK